VTQLLRLNSKRLEILIVLDILVHRLPDDLLGLLAILLPPLLILLLLGDALLPAVSITDHNVNLLSPNRGHLQLHAP
jgi:hypothetical protein